MVGRYADALGSANGRLPVAVRRDLAERLLLLSSYYKLDPCLLGALVSVESAWRSRAVSPVGALGFGQLMPGTAASLNVDPLEPYENLDGTARYLRRAMNRYVTRDLQTRMRLALASYNAGPAAVARYNGVPPYRETRAYVDNVLRMRRAFAAKVDARMTFDVAAFVASRPVAPTDSAASKKQIASVKLVASRHSPRSAKTYRKHALPRVEPVRPTRLALATPPPQQWETSHSFFARMLGLRHRVARSSTVAVGDASTDRQVEETPAVLPP
ncbi:MAG: lytic transglycosylase, catalytic [Candidatus Eremiobacteraeota bacterium]|nr:lytic transglycosylase, catalytic [Candidatus Eremiobacteraeota bacterium]